MHRKRILKHADFIATLKPAKLLMTTVTQMDDGKMDPYKCSSVACAMGWTPAVFPRLIEWTMLGSLRMKESRKRDYSAMVELFDISMDHAGILFGGGGDRFYHTPKQVAAGLRRYAESGGTKLPRED